MTKHERETCAVCGLDPVVGSPTRPSRIVAQSAVMRALLSRVRRFADTSAPVVILGESGTGKEVVARALHGSSTRRDAASFARTSTTVTASAKKALGRYAWPGNVRELSSTCYASSRRSLTPASRSR